MRLNHFVNLKTGILLIVCLFAFVACGGGDAAPTVATETTTSAEAPKAETQAEAPPVEAQIEEVIIESSAVSVRITRILVFHYLWKAERWLTRWLGQPTPRELLLSIMAVSMPC